MNCLSIRAHLEAFADGELRGDALRRVSKHVESCASCANDVAETRSLGDALRSRVAPGSADEDLAGLADGVVSRIKAEARESWRARFDRAFDDLHWVVVGAGSMAAAFISLLLVSAVFQSAVVQRDDSLAAMLNTFGSPAPRLRFTTVLPASLTSLPTDDLQMVNLAVVTEDGRVMSLYPVSSVNSPASSTDRQDDQVVMHQLSGLRFSHQDRQMVDPAERRFVWLYSVTEVRGKIGARGL
jgi:hypothetical protein